MARHPELERRMLQALIKKHSMPQDKSNMTTSGQLDFRIALDQRLTCILSPSVEAVSIVVILTHFTIACLCVLWSKHLVCQGCHKEIPQTVWLKEQKCIFLLLWRLEVNIKVPVGLVSSEASLGGLQMAASLLPLHVILLPLCVQAPAVSLCVLISFSQKDTNQIGLSPTPWGRVSHFNLIIFVKAPSPNTGTRGKGFNI